MVDMINSHLNVVVLPLLVALPTVAGVEVHLNFEVFYHYDFLLK